MSGASHYQLQPDGEIATRAAATADKCHPYLVMRGATNVLCVIEGGAFHTFEISEMGLKRLAAEAADRVWKNATRRPAT